MENTASARDDGFFTQPFTGAVSDPALVDEIIGWYIDVFNAVGPDEWNEHWTADEVRKKLFLDTAADAERSFVTTWRSQGRLAGLGIVVVAPVSRFAASDLPPGCQDGSVLSGVRRSLGWLVGPETPILFYREFGLRKEFRGGLAPILRLLGDSLEAGMGIGAEYACCWTSRKKRLYPILVGLDLHLAYAFGDEQDNVLVGDVFPHLLRKIRTSPDEAALHIRERIAAHRR
ncbi:MAG TPA: hypothetical protein VLC10_02520 [Patescibacteria group bacterium]|nr:hypothetical protein [Patescibacteria group bacterium]